MITLPSTVLSAFKITTTTKNREEENVKYAGKQSRHI
jgi:hypothetical protein